VKDAEYPKLGSPTIGTEFELNDHRGVITGIARVPASTIFGTPTLYTTYARAIQYVPSMRYTISYVLVEPKDPAAMPHIKAEVGRLGYDALTHDEFIARTTCHSRKPIARSDLKQPVVRSGDVIHPFPGRRRWHPPRVPALVAHPEHPWPTPGVCASGENTQRIWREHADSDPR